MPEITLLDALFYGLAAVAVLGGILLIGYLLGREDDE